VIGPNARAEQLYPGTEGVLVWVEHLVKHFSSSPGGSRDPSTIHAVDDVSFDVREGEAFGVVGESGSGKSTTARCLLRLIEPTSGDIFFEGVDVRALGAEKLRLLRARMQIVFQDPFASLNPRMRVSSIIEEPLQVHGMKSRNDRMQRVRELIDLVGLEPEHLDRYPSEFSGGQRQRIGIARALALNPRFVVLDEPVSALDVSMQAQVLNLLQDLQERLGLTYLFIAHDIALIRHVCTRLAVMYLGRVVELADRDGLFSHPLHPYTWALLSAVPIPNPAEERARPRVILGGDPPSPFNVPSGCRFHPRCPVGGKKEICATVDPQLREVVPRHWVACHFPRL